MKKFMSLVVGVGMVAVFALAFAASPTHAQNPTQQSKKGQNIVDCDDGDSLQEEINEADFGDELQVRGTCEGRIFITKNISLRGPATLSAPNGGFAVVTIEDGGHGTLRDLHIDGSDTQLAIFMDGGTARFEEVVAQYSGEGLRLAGASYALIVQSEFSYNQIGMLVITSSSFRLHDSKVVKNIGDGINMFGSSSAALFSGNEISRNGRHGITISSSGSFQMSGSTITYNGGDGVRTSTYSFVNLFNPPNTIQENATDVRCFASGGLNMSSPQMSTTERVDVDVDTCIIFGDIFDPAP